MINRPEYLNWLIRFKDHENIKIVTGIRRGGKSSLLLLFQEYLKSNGVNDEQIISINFEDLSNRELYDYLKLHEYVMGRIVKGKKNYIFLDEIQHVMQFEKTVDSFFINKDIDVYLTGSNSYLLSSELSTLLTGRYVELKVLPLSFKEFLDFKTYDKTDIETKFQEYMRIGSFPAVALLNDEKLITPVLQGIYDSVIMKDVALRGKILDLALLEKVTRYVFDNIGNIISAKSIADFLSSSGRKTSHNTIDSYLKLLSEVYIIYKAMRYNIIGRESLKTLAKYYIVDNGIRNASLGLRNNNRGSVLENIIYLELVRRGYEVSVGKYENKEIDFVCSKIDDFIYIQVALDLANDEKWEQETRGMIKIADNFEKILITMNKWQTGTFKGIKVVYAIDFLLGES